MRDFTPLTPTASDIKMFCSFTGRRVLGSPTDELDSANWLNAFVNTTGGDGCVLYQQRFPQGDVHTLRAIELASDVCVHVHVGKIRKGRVFRETGWVINLSLLFNGSQVFLGAKVVDGLDAVLDTIHSIDDLELDFHGMKLATMDAVVEWL